MKKIKKVSLALSFIFIFFLFLLFLYSPNTCKKNIYENIFTLKFNLNSNCKADFRIKIIRQLKKNDKIFTFLKKFYYIFNKEKYEFYYSKKKKIDNIYDQVLPQTIKGVLDNNKYTVKDKIIPKNEISKWYRSHGGNYNLKYSHDDLINLSNINKIELKWKHQSINEKDLGSKWINSVQVNPIYINEKLISVFPDGSTKAFDPLNGKIIWEFNNSRGFPNRRGILAYQDNDQEYLFVSYGSEMFKLNAINGKIIKSFGTTGSVIVKTLVAPLIFKDYLVVINLKDIFLFDKNSGNLISKIDIHQKKYLQFSGNIWGGSALDEKNGLLFVVTGNAKQRETYGGGRIGKSDRSNSIIAINLNKKKVEWTFQETIHDTWNFDISSPPIIHDLEIDNKIYQTVIVSTKVGNTFILDRKSGKPIFDIDYKKAPEANLLGDISAPYQLWLNKPERFFKIEYDLSSFNKLEDKKIKYIKKKLINSKVGWYEKPSLTKDLIIFGLHGGAQWHGSALDPFNQFLYIPTNNVPFKIRPYLEEISATNIKIPTEFKLGEQIYLDKCSSCHKKNRSGINKKHYEKSIKYIPSLVGYFLDKNQNNKNIFNVSNLKNQHDSLSILQEELNHITEYFSWRDKKMNEEGKLILRAGYNSWSRFLTEDDLPASNPPWGYIAKINLKTGNIEYKAPIGYEKINQEKKLIGTIIFGGLAINKGNLIFATGTADKYAYILNANNGKILWKFKMEAAGSAPPIIFNYKNKQYFSFISTGGTFFPYKEKGSTLYTFGLE